MSDDAAKPLNPRAKLGPGFRPPPARIVGYDVARCVALFGMMAQHFIGVMTDMGERPLIELLPDERLMRKIQEALNGRFASLFVVLAGVGFTLATRRARESEDLVELERAKTIMRRRAWFLFFAGLGLSFVWVTEILHFYAVYIALACFFIREPGWVLWVWALLAIFGQLALFQWVSYTPAYGGQTYHFWNGGLNFGTGVPVHPNNMDGLGDALREIFFNGAHPVFPWMAFFLAGMWLGRQSFTGKSRCWFIGLSLATCIFAESLSAYLRDATPVWRQTAYGWALNMDRVIVSRDIHPPAPLFVLSAGASAFATIGACLWIGERFGDRFWLRWLQATGQMTLTLYVAHIMLGMGWLYREDMLNNNPLEVAISYTLLFLGLAVAFAATWRSLVYWRGPLEWLMRRTAER